MNRNNKPKKQTEDVGPNTAREWFHSVINPMIEALNEERHLLVNENWTWLYRQRILGSIKYYRSLVDSEAWPNQDHIEEFYPKLRKYFEENDRYVLELTKKCEQLHEAVKKHPKLLRIYRKTTSPGELSKMGMTLTSIFGAYPEHDHLQLLAQYIVNNTEELPYYYYAALYWNRYKAELRSVLREPEVKALNDEAKEAGKKLLKSINDLSKELERIRETLSAKHDISYAPPLTNFV